MGVLCLVLVFLFSIFCPSSFAIILMGKRELVALLFSGSLVTVSVLRLFLMVPWVGLQCVIGVFPDILSCFFEGVSVCCKREINSVSEQMVMRLFVCLF